MNREGPEAENTLRQTLEARLTASTPRVLSLLDKNPLSPTAGSFDRKHWHYKILDFPCGMQQELVLPLAYVWLRTFPGNPYHGLERIEQFIKLALEFHAVASHPDGALDDYFPYERAYGATAYGLAAVSETAILTGLASDSAIAAMERSGKFLASYREAGTLSNHLAIAALALINLHILTGRSRWREASDRLVESMAALWRPEGWFKEYEGCDLGYQTVTVEFLARRHLKAPDQGILGFLRDNVAFIRRFLHPDGSLGGEYGSRNTYNFYPGGFAILSTLLPDAAEILAGFQRGLGNGSENRLEDDGVFGHLLSSYVTVLQCPEIRLKEPPPAIAVDPPVVEHFPAAGLFVGRTGALSVYGATRKGGVCKVFRKDELAWSDTGLAGRLTNGTPFLQNKPEIAEATVDAATIRVEGRLQRFRSPRLTLLKNALLRLAGLTLGPFRFYSNLVRWAMQKALIFNKKPLPVSFERTIRLTRGRVTIEDELTVAAGTRVELLYRTPDCVNIHVITSDSFQKANLIPWERLDVTPDGNKLKYVKVIDE